MAGSTDPTKTLTVRREFSGEAYARLRHIRGLVRTSLVDRDALRVNQPDFGQPLPAAPPDSATPARVQHFMDWLQRTANAGVLGTTDRDAAPRLGQHWAGQYVRRAYAQGVQRARQQVGTRPEQDGAAGETAAALGGAAALLALPAHGDALDMQWDRTWNALRAAVEQAEHVARQRLIDGLARGDGTRDLAAAINDAALDRVATRRARLVARTEVVRAHAEAQLNEFRRQGVEEVGAEVEFRTARDDRVCPICKELDGVAFSVDDAHGIIPVHPNCRCIWLPVVR